MASGHFGLLNIKNIHPFGSDLKSFIQFLHLSLHLLTLFSHLNSVSLPEFLSTGTENVFTNDSAL